MNDEQRKALVKRAQAGDADAFGELYADMRQELYRFAYYQTSSPHLAEDAVGDAVLLAFQNITKLRKPQSFRAWQCSILLNCCREKQTEKARLMGTESLDDFRHVLPQETDLASHAALHAALRTLSDSDRELILLSVLFGYTSKELSSLLSIRPGSVRARLSRIKERMRAQLEEGDDQR